jgi:thymidylate synthase
MRIFNHAMEMVREVERDLFEMGITVCPETMQDKVAGAKAEFETIEVQAYGYTLTNLDMNKVYEAIDYMKGNKEWAVFEMIDRIDPRYINPGKAYLNAPELWEQFLRDGQFAYTYNERFREQLPTVIRELQLRPNTRQAVMTMYDRHQDMNNWGGKDRIPCSLTYQFYIRGGQLHLIYTMRSCDFLTHFIHDVFFAVSLLNYVADELRVPVGNMTHFMGSLHAYKKDMTTRGIF